MVMSGSNGELQMILQSLSPSLPLWIRARMNCRGSMNFPILLNQGGVVPHPSFSYQATNTAETVAMEPWGGFCAVQGLNLPID